MAQSILFVLVWSSGYLVGSVGARHGPPLALLAWRLLLALAVLVAVAAITRAPWPDRPVQYLHLLVAGTLLQTVQLGGIYIGLGLGVPAGLSSLILSASPLLVSAAAGPLLSEWLAPRQWAGLGLGLAGVAVSLSRGLTGGAHLVGYAFTALALIGFAAGTLYQKRFGTAVDLRTATTIQVVGATITSFPLAALHGGLGLPGTAPVLGALVWLAIVNSIGSFALLFALLRRRSGGAATSLLYLVPPVTALLAVPILGQPVAPEALVGMGLSGVGVGLVVAGPRRAATSTARNALRSIVRTCLPVPQTMPRRGSRG
jgi:drug/metabolite transporter (DMT)-like permease